MVSAQVVDHGQQCKSRGSNLHPRKEKADFVAAKEELAEGDSTVSAEVKAKADLFEARFRVSLRSLRGPKEIKDALQQMRTKLGKSKSVPSELVGTMMRELEMEFLA